MWWEGRCDTWGSAESYVHNTYSYQFNKVMVLIGICLAAVAVEVPAADVSTDVALPAAQTVLDDTQGLLFHWWRDPQKHRPQDAMSDTRIYRPSNHGHNSTRSQPYRVKPLSNTQDGDLSHGSRARIPTESPLPESLGG